MTINTKHSISTAKKIYYDKGRFRINLEFLLLCLIINIYFMFFANLGAVLWILLIAIGALIYYNYELYRDRQPQIIISKEGIQTNKTPFYKWSEIQNCEVEEVYRGKGYAYYLSYKYPGGQLRRDIDKLNIEHEQLDALIKYYSNTNAQ